MLVVVVGQLGAVVGVVAEVEVEGPASRAEVPVFLLVRWLALALAGAASLAGGPYLAWEALVLSFFAGMVARCLILMS